MAIEDYEWFKKLHEDEKKLLIEKFQGQRIGPNFLDKKLDDTEDSIKYYEIILEILARYKVTADKQKLDNAINMIISYAQVPEKKYKQEIIGKLNELGILESSVNIALYSCYDELAPYMNADYSDAKTTAIKKIVAEVTNNSLSKTRTSISETLHTDETGAKIIKETKDKDGIKFEILDKKNDSQTITIPLINPNGTLSKEYFEVIEFDKDGKIIAYTSPLFHIDNNSYIVGSHGLGIKCTTQLNLQWLQDNLAQRQEHKLNVSISGSAAISTKKTPVSMAEKSASTAPIPTTPVASTASETEAASAGTNSTSTETSSSTSIGTSTEAKETKEISTSTENTSDALAEQQKLVIAELEERVKLQQEFSATFHDSMRQQSQEMLSLLQEKAHAQTEEKLARKDLEYKELESRLKLSEQQKAFITEQFETNSRDEILKYEELFREELVKNHGYSLQIAELTKKNSDLTLQIAESLEELQQNKSELDSAYKALSQAKKQLDLAKDTNNDLAAINKDNIQKSAEKISELEKKLQAQTKDLQSKLAVTTNQLKQANENLKTQKQLFQSTIQEYKEKLAAAKKKNQTQTEETKLLESTIASLEQKIAKIDQISIHNENTILSYKAEIDKLNIVIAETTARNEALTLATKEKQQILVTKISSLEEQLEKAISNGSVSEGQIAALTLELDSSKDALAQAEKEADDAKAQISELSAKLESAKQALVQAQSNGDASEEEKNNLQQKITKLESQLQQTAIALEDKGRIDIATFEDESRSALIALAQAQRDGIASKAKILAELESSKETVNEAKKELAQAKGNAATSEAQISELSAKLESAKQALVQAQSNGDASEEEKNNLQQKITKLESQLQQTAIDIEENGRIDIATFEDESRSALIALAQAQRDGIASKAKILELSAALESSKEALAQAQKEADDSKTNHLQLSAEINSLRKKIESDGVVSEEEKGKLEAQMSELQSQLQQVTKDLEAKESQKSALEKKLESAEKDMNEARESLEKAKGNAATSEDKTAELSATLESAEKALAKLVAENSSSKKAADEARKALAQETLQHKTTQRANLETSQDLERQVLEHQENIDRLNLEVKDITAKQQILLAKNVSLEKAADEARKALVQAEEKATADETQISELEQQLKSVEEDLEQTNLENDNMGRELQFNQEESSKIIFELEKSRYALVGRVSQLKAEIEENGRKEIDRINTTIESLENSIALNQTEINSLMESKRTYKADIEKLNGENEHLKQQLQESQNEFNKLNGHHVQLREKYTNVFAELENLKKDYRASQELQTRIDQMNTEIDQLKKDPDATQESQTKIDQMSAEISQLKKERDEYNSAKNEAQKKLEQLQSENSRLTRSIDNLHQRLEKSDKSDQEILSLRDELIELHLALEQSEKELKNLYVTNVQTASIDTQTDDRVTNDSNTSGYIAENDSSINTGPSTPYKDQTLQSDLSSSEPSTPKSEPDITYSDESDARKQLETDFQTELDRLKIQETESGARKHLETKFKTELDKIKQTLDISLKKISDDKTKAEFLKNTKDLKQYYITYCKDVLGIPEPINYTSFRVLFFNITNLENNLSNAQNEQEIQKHQIDLINNYVNLFIEINNTQSILPSINIKKTNEYNGKTPQLCPEIFKKIVQPKIYDIVQKTLKISISDVFSDSKESITDICKKLDKILSSKDIQHNLGVINAINTLTTSLEELSTKRSEIMNNKFFPYSNEHNSTQLGTTPLQQYLSKLEIVNRNLTILETLLNNKQKGEKKTISHAELTSQITKIKNFLSPKTADPVVHIDVHKTQNQTHSR
jgi:chromosome segregation ATPase